MLYGRPHVLVRWAGRDASGDTWEQLERLSNREAVLIALENWQATGRALPRPALQPPAAASPPPPLQPTGFTVDAAPPGVLGAALEGRQLLYWWQDNGLQRGTVASLCPHGAFSHVVACCGPVTATGNRDNEEILHVRTNVRTSSQYHGRSRGGWTRISTTVLVAS